MAKQGKNSKYSQLQQTLECEWVEPPGVLTVLCGSTFTDMDIFIQHVRDQHIIDDGDGSLLNKYCQWKECAFETSSSEQFMHHLLFHPYHSYQKLLGSEVVAKNPDLPQCLSDGAMRNLIPDFDQELKCLWGDCGSIFDCVSDFYRHIHEHAVKDTEHRCRWKDCSFKAGSRTKIRDHTRSHLHEKTVACPTCGSLFVNNTKLQDHLRRQLDPSDLSLVCSFCHKCFQSERILREHVRKHINSLKCPHCELTCNAPSRLLAHIRHRHMDSKPHSCPLCHKKFKTACLLGEHIECHRDKTLQCSMPACRYVARTSRSLSMHLKRAHQPEEKLYSCHVCSERYTTGQKLTFHLKVNHGFILPPGHCRFRYVAGLDGVKRLQTVRLDDENVVTPEVSTITQSGSTSSPITTTCD